MGQYLQNLSQKVITVTLCRFGLHNMNNILHHENSVEVINHTNLYNIIVGTPGLGYPLLLCLGKGLVVILNYALTAEQPDPCGPEPYSPGKRPRTRSPLREGPVTPLVPEEVALSQNSWGPRTSQGVPDPIYYPDPSAERNRHPAWGWSGAATCQWVRPRARDREASPGRLAYQPHSIR